jgi:hypothetical protein
MAATGAPTLGADTDAILEDTLGLAANKIAFPVCGGRIRAIEKASEITPFLVNGAIIIIPNYGRVQH